MDKPLAEILRPQKIEEFVGQKHLVGKNGIIRILLKDKSANFPSLIFWGSPGVGKTTLARIIAKSLKRDYFEFSAVSSSIKEVENIVKKEEKSPVIVIDEIHRFNKSQQAKFLPWVETGKIILIGATTENPSFEVIAPLLSRTKVLVFSQLEKNELKKIAQKGLNFLKAKIKKDALDFLIEGSSGDGRILLNTLEVAKNLLPKNQEAINISTVEQAFQKRQLFFDKKGEEYYNLISAFIKSMRASDVDAALYYLARMVESGQDPLYIARRMIIFASEDVATPTALVVANSVFQACHEVGLPECQENLAAGAVYLATAKKDRSAYEAYMRALDDVRRFGHLPVPLKIRNPVTKLMKDLKYGKGYEKYTKDSLLPDKLKGKRYYFKKENDSRV
ncbi:MAG: ATPase AAA [Patescibacteria group bacterium]|nr:MAG: ATPase AAA [Patescibacteria group bacterium]